MLAAILLILGTVDANGQDVTAPELDRAIVDGANLVVFYDEMLDENSVPTVAAKMDTLVDGSRETSRTSALAAGTYRIVVTSGEQEKESLVTSVAISGNEVRLTLAPPVACGASVVVSYSIPPLNPIRDTAGNEAVAFNDHEVTNSTQCPVSGTELGLALGSVAAVVLGTSILNQSDTEVPALAYTGTLAEAAANDGSVTGSIAATLTGSTFTPTVVSAPHVTVSNVPAGLTASLVRTSATVVTLTLTGTSNAHANANDVSNLTITFSDDAFTIGSASAVSGSTRNDLTINFRDASAIMWAGSLTEVAANDGSVTGSITATLAGDTYTSMVVSAPHVTVANIPAGLTASLVRTSATVVTLTLTGTANAHTNDVSNISVTFSDGAFTNEGASTVTGSSKSDIGIDFRDASTITWAGTLTEAAANDGSVTGSITATLVGDTFTPAVIFAPHVSVSNVPAGLTASLV
ncbi:MAG: SwmB domain-containing protein, partial [Bacteroidota bacterium]|nr:SwmB domain-containing protein [Bacteroidota bacterium]